jgi:hypothetical protein
MMMMIPQQQPHPQQPLPQQPHPATPTGIVSQLSSLQNSSSTATVAESHRASFTEVSSALQPLPQQSEASADDPYAGETKERERERERKKREDEERRQEKPIDPSLVIPRSLTDFTCALYTHSSMPNEKVYKN